MSADGSNALLSDIQARAERQRLQTRDERWHDLVLESWRASQAAATPAEARRWLERAHRMLPKDGLISTTLAAARLQDGDFAGAATLFEAVGRTHDVAEAWVGLALCARILGQADRAQLAMQNALHAGVPTAEGASLAEQIARDMGVPGWCGLSVDGVLHAGPVPPASVGIDGRAVRLRWSGGKARLPPGWRAAQAITIGGGSPWLGSPLPVQRLCRVEGAVTREGGAVIGWAWYPADPRVEPPLTLVADGVERAIVFEGRADASDLGHPLARPWAFRLDALPPGMAAVLTADGRHLLGSPIGSQPEEPVAHADHRGPTPRPGRTKPPVDVIIPAYRGLAQTMACLDSVWANVLRGSRIIVVDDASPEPALVAALDALAAAGRILLVRLAQNGGFPAAANAGLRACAGRDAVLLNSDTLVPPGWLKRLRAAAYAAPDIGTATPLSNDATILSYPAVGGNNAIPDLRETIAFDALAQAVNGSRTVDIPTGIGFCLYLRRDCLDQTGLLREDAFAQGYGEENDLCLRARHLGWRSVAAAGVFVGHVGGQSFGAGRAALLRRNLLVLNRMYPGYDSVIAAFVAADPLAPMRRAMDARRFHQSEGRAVLLVTHAGGGGVDRVIDARCAAARAAGFRPIVLRPVRGRPGACRVLDGAATPNLIYTLPAELPDLIDLLAATRPVHLEVHHRLGHAPEIMALPERLGIPADHYVHDYSSFCQRIALTGPQRRYCGEPDVQGCIDCIADLGTLFEESISMPDLLTRSARDFNQARRVVAPSDDAARRIQRHFPSVRPIVTPWDDDATLPPLRPIRRAPIRRVGVIGAIGREKGYEVLLACVRDARDRRLPIAFTVIGYTEDDPRLMAAGPAWVTGEFQDATALALIEAEAPDLLFLPSIWPETWCFALTRAWESGRAVMAFDIGAPAARIRSTGRGWLLPLGLGAGAINDALLSAALPPRLAPTGPARHRNGTIRPAASRVGP